MAKWLKALGIEDVVMQSTGVYWIAVYEMLEQYGFKVCLSNARDTKNLPGRKSDVQECQWLRKLHTYGLLGSSFHPPEEIRSLRTIWRLRGRHVVDACREIQHMQKALTTMNVQLANVISDITGTTGQAIIRAIVKGERDIYQLARMRDCRIQASEEEIARSLEGNWNADVLFELEQAVERYDFCQKQIGACDERLKKQLAEMPDGKVPEPIAVKAESQPLEEKPEGEQAKGKGQGKGKGKGKAKGKKASKKARQGTPQFDLRSELTRICGVNLTSIDGVDVMTVQTWVSGVGVDLTAWKTENHIVSWLNLCPRRDISGGKLIKHSRKKIKNEVGEALKMAASSLLFSDSYLGARYRYLRGRLGPAKAVKAMAAYLARLIYRMLKHGQEWVDSGARQFEEQRKQRELRSLQRKAAALGLRLEPAA